MEIVLNFLHGHLDLGRRGDSDVTNQTKVTREEKAGNVLLQLFNSFCKKKKTSPNDRVQHQIYVHVVFGVTAFFHL